MVHLFYFSFLFFSFLLEKKEKRTVQEIQLKRNSVKKPIVSYSAYHTDTCLLHAQYLT